MPSISRTVASVTLIGALSAGLVGTGALPASATSPPSHCTVIREDLWLSIANDVLFLPANQTSRETNNLQYEYDHDCT